MGRLSKRIRQTVIDQGSLAVFWISQAGFVYKTASGNVIYVDPYLTDCVARILPEDGYGFKRIMASPIEAEEVEADFVVSTHNHPDRLDIDALPILMRNPRTHFVGAPDCLSNYQELGPPQDRYTIIKKGQTVDW